MITPTQMYLITRLDSIHLVFAVAIIPAMLLAGLAAVIGLVKYVNDYDDEEHDFGARLLRRALRVFAICVVASIFEALIPTTKEMAAITVVPRIANNERLQEAGNRLFDLATAWMEELAPKKKGGAE